MDSLNNELGMRFTIDGEEITIRVQGFTDPITALKALMMAGSQETIMTMADRIDHGDYAGHEEIRP